MNTYVVTIKKLKNPSHNPAAKVTDLCGWSNLCTDATGEHHSFILKSSLTPAEVARELESRGTHVTRVEHAWTISWNDDDNGDVESSRLDLL